MPADILEFLLNKLGVTVKLLPELSDLITE